MLAKVNDVIVRRYQFREENSAQTSSPVFFRCGLGKSGGSYGQILWRCGGVQSVFEGLSNSGGNIEVISHGIWRNVCNPSARLDMETAIRVFGYDSQFRSRLNTS